MRSASSEGVSTEVSRRSFVKLAVGSIVVLPTVANTLIPPAASAFAAETEPTAKLVSSSSVYIVRTSELGLVVRDVSQPDSSENLVSNAHVKIASRYNGVVLEGDTDDKGGIALDISKLAEGDGKKESPARYEFNATIEVSAPGYRTFISPLYRAIGGTALSIPTQPVKSGIPYPVSASFDEWDVLYTEGDSVSFVSSTGNDTTHSIAVRLAGCPQGAAIAGGIYVDGKQVAAAGARAQSDGAAVLSFLDKFLLTGNSAALPVGEDHAYTVRYTIGDTTYEVPIKPNVSEAPPEAQTQQLKHDLELSPFNDTTMFIGFTVPDNWPIIGGNKFKLWQPELPFNISFDPFGFIRIQATTPPLGYVNDFGETDESRWKLCPRSSAKEQFNKLLKTAQEQTEKSMTALAKDGFVKQIGFTNKLSFTMQVEFMAAATWSFKDKESRGRGSIGLCFGANYSLMETLWAGPFPIVVRFSIGLNGRLCDEIGFISPSVWSFSKYRWDWSSTGADLQLCFSPILSVGVGIGGVCSLSLKGAFSVTFCLHEGFVPEGFENYPMPHVRLAGHAALSAEVELLFFTKSYTIINQDWPDWYDNWDGVALKDTSAPAPALQGARLGDALDDAKIITEESLAAVAEFQIGSIQDASPKPTVLSHYVLSRITEDGETPITDMFVSEDAVLGMQQDRTLSLAAQSATSPASQRKAASGAGGLVAGSSAALIAQDDQAEYVLRAANDQATLWETKLPAASAIGEHSYVPASAERPGVLRLGKEQGIVTSIDTRIADNILSASRFKLFSAGGSDYIVRLGVVMVAGKVRTRLIAELVGGNTRRVIDFKTNVDHDACFDYDFDISTTHVNGEELVNLVVISGVRPSGDATSLTEAVGQTFLSFLSCKNWNGDATFTGVTLDATFVDAIGDRGATYPYRSYSCPQLRQIVGTKNGKQYGQAVVTFLERAARHQAAIMGDDPDLTRAGVGLLFFNDVDQSIFVSGMDVMRPVVMQKVNDPSLTEVTLSEHIDGWQVVTLKGTEKTYHVLVETDPCVTVIGDEGIPMAKAAYLVDLGAYEDKVTRLIPVPAQGYFLTAIDGKLTRVNVVAGDDTATLAFSDVEGTEVNLNDFGVTSSGDVLYWPAMRENGGYAADENGNMRMRDGEEGELNLIMGARIRNGKVSRAMTLSEVSHPIHRIRSFGQSGSYLSFISSTTVDSQAGKGEQWYTAVPWVRCVVLEDAEPNGSVFSGGDHLSFSLKLRNDGNCFLAGVELAVAEVGHEPFGTMRLNFSEDTTMQSEWNPRGEDGKLQNVEDDWALAPGMSARYNAGYVTIPDTWQGTKEIEVFVTAIYTAGSGSLTAGAEEESLEYIPVRRVHSVLSLDGGKNVLDFAGTYSAADVTVMGDRISPEKQEPEAIAGRTPASPAANAKAPSGEASQSTSSGAAASRSSSVKSGVPSTGDAVSLAALAAAGAAGVVAHHALCAQGKADDANQQDLER